MTNLAHKRLAEGISAVLPLGWEYSAESADGFSTYCIEMTNGSCNVELELLNRRQLSPMDFISAYRFNLMKSLIGLDLNFDPLNKDFPLELIATKNSLIGKVVHILIPSDPVAHLSAMVQTEGDLAELRVIAQSITIDE